MNSKYSTESEEMNKTNSTLATANSSHRGDMSIVSDTSSKGIRGDMSIISASSKGMLSVVVDPEALRDQLATLEESDGGEGLKQKIMCCGSCCDVRLACLIIDAIYFSFVILALLWNLNGWAGFEGGTVGIDLSDTGGDDDGMYDDDEYDDGSNNILGTDMLFRSSMFQLCFGIFFSVTGFAGAYKFWWIPVLGMTIWLFIDVVLYCVFFNWISAVTVGLYSYPHVVLFRALKSGKLTVDTYEKHCCSFKTTDDDSEE